MTTRRGVGRFVTDSIPRNGLESLRPSRSPSRNQAGELDVEPIGFEPEGTTDFVSTVSLSIAQRTHGFERASSPMTMPAVAAVQEHLPAGRYLSLLSPRLFAERPRSRRSLAPSSRL